MCYLGGEVATMACASQMMARNLRNGFKDVEDLKLLKRLRSTLQFYLLFSRDPSEEVKRGSLGGFVLDSDSQHTQDVTLRRKGDSGEEITISAVLAPPIRSETICLPMDMFMKVCVKKPAMSSIMRFDCTVYDYYKLVVKNAYLGSPTCHRGPLFSKLDLKLHDTLKDYLIAKGTGVSLTNSLHRYLCRRRDERYMNWLKEVEAFVAK